jgi:hypothetical protein
MPIVAMVGFDPGRAKTAALVALAVELGARGKKVIIVDADPEVTSAVDRGALAWAQRAKQAGRRPPDVVRLRAAPELWGLLGEYDFALIDCPPDAARTKEILLEATEEVWVAQRPGPGGDAAAELALVEEVVGIRADETTAGGSGDRALVRRSIHLGLEGDDGAVIRDLVPHLEALEKGEAARWTDDTSAPAKEVSGLADALQTDRTSRALPALGPDLGEQDVEEDTAPDLEPPPFLRSQPLDLVEKDGTRRNLLPEGWSAPAAACVLLNTPKGATGVDLTVRAGTDSFCRLRLQLEPDAEREREIELLLAIGRSGQIVAGACGPGSPKLTVLPPP